MNIFNTITKLAFAMLLGLGALAYGQVGINTTSPQSTLDVALATNYASGNKAGISIPQLTGDQIEAMTTTGLKFGTLVYSTAASTATTKNVNAIGFWYWKNSTEKWVPIIGNAPGFFYSPSIPIDTTIATGTIDLYANYKNQFTTPMASSTGSTGSIPVYGSSQLEYYVTWYDNTIFSSVSIDANGVLTYNISNTTSGKVTYMNVVFAVKK